MLDSCPQHSTDKEQIKNYREQDAMMMMGNVPVIPPGAVMQVTPGSGHELGPRQRINRTAMWLTLFAAEAAYAAVKCSRPARDRRRAGTARPLLARRELSVGRPDLFVGQSAAARTLA